MKCTLPPASAEARAEPVVQVARRDSLEPRESVAQVASAEPVAREGSRVNPVSQANLAAKNPGERPSVSWPVLRPIDPSSLAVQKEAPVVQVVQVGQVARRESLEPQELEAQVAPAEQVVPQASRVSQVRVDLQSGGKRSDSVDEVNAPQEPKGAVDPAAPLAEQGALAELAAREEVAGPPVGLEVRARLPEVRAALQVLAEALPVSLGEAKADSEANEPGAALGLSQPQISLAEPDRPRE
ncbi:MAG: hypothetical protein ACKV0T_18270 [Planctomycetales bacterium]